jgi:hypothetical protein
MRATVRRRMVMERDISENQSDVLPGDAGSGTYGRPNPLDIDSFLCRPTDSTMDPGPSTEVSAAVSEVFSAWVRRDAAFLGSYKCGCGFDPSHHADECAMEAQAALGKPG